MGSPYHGSPGASNSLLVPPEPPGSIIPVQVSLVPMAASTPESLFQGSLHLSVPPILGAVVCPVSSSLFWIQEELLIFQSIQFSPVVRVE